MTKDLFDEIIEIENIERAYHKSREGAGKYKVRALKFTENESSNLAELRDELINGTYAPEPYVEFRVFEPKERVIHAPAYRDKIVQLAINNVLKNVYNRAFIYDSYACIDGKGTHRAVLRVSDFLKRAHHEYGDGAYSIKLDMKRFFYSIDRAVLKRLLRAKVKCERTLALLDVIIDSADAIDERGLPLGNTLSQLFANIVMDRLDQYCKRVLSVKYYVRYADDVIAIMPSKDEAQRVITLMREFTDIRLNIRVNAHKTKIFPISQGVNAYGFKIYVTHRLLRDDSKRKIKRKLGKFPRLLREGKLEPSKVEQIANSWFGHARLGNNYNFMAKLLAKHDWLEMTQGKLKIRKAVI